MLRVILCASVLTLSLGTAVHAQVTAPAAPGQSAIPEKNLTRDTDQPKAKGGAGSDPAKEIETTGSLKSRPADTSDALKPMNHDPQRK